MSDTTASLVRGLLEEERARLREQIQGLGGQRGVELDYDENFADSGQVTAERGEVEALAVQLRETLTDIEDALAKLDAGTYGSCERCGQPIGDARLEAMPAARLCMTCATCVIMPIPDRASIVTATRTSSMLVPRFAAPNGEACIMGVHSSSQHARSSRQSHCRQGGPTHRQDGHR